MIAQYVFPKLVQVLTSGLLRGPQMTLNNLRKKGFFHLLSANFLAQFLSFGSLLLVARLLSPAEFGEIRIIQSYVSLFTILAGGGLSTAVHKYCAESRTSENKDNILRHSLVIASMTTVITLAFMVVLAMAGGLAKSSRFPLWLLVYALGVIPCAVMSDILALFLQAQKRIKEVAGMQALMKGLAFGVVVISTWLGGFHGFIASTIVASLVGLLTLLRLVRLRFFNAHCYALPEQFANFAFFSVLAGAINIYGQYTDIFILDYFVRDRVEIGYYSLATIFLLGAIQVTTTIQTLATPYFSERAHDQTWFRRKLIQTQTRLAALSVAVAVAVYIAAAVLVYLIYGANYRASLLYLGILLVKYILYSSSAMISIALIGLGLVRYNFAAVAVATPAGLALSYSLLQRFGVAGVAWAQVGSAAIVLIMLLILYRRALKRSFNEDASAIPSHLFGFSFGSIKTIGDG